MDLTPGAANIDPTESESIPVIVNPIPRPWLAWFSCKTASFAKDIGDRDRPPNPWNARFHGAWRVRRHPEDESRSF